MILALSTVTALVAGAPPASGQRVASRAPEVRLVKVHTAERPIGFARHPDGTVYVHEQGGRLLRLGSGGEGAAVALDVVEEISSGGERGLLGAAFSPDGTSLYVNVTNRDGDTEVAAYDVTDGVAERSSRRLLLRIEQPFANHNGGQLWVTGDGVLWIGTGDGGSGGDPENHGQRTDSLLGKILRIDPRPGASGSAYRIPPGNIVRAGVRPEIWAYGLRNPWRFSIDARSSTIWIGDVGQNAWEEIDAVPIGRAGANFGWKRREGTRAYQSGTRPRDNVEPVHTYGRGDGCSVTGGVVYRGTALPSLQGAYVFSDYCKGDLRALVPDGRRRRLVRLGVSLANPTAFGTDADSELLVASADGDIMRVSAA